MRARTTKSLYLNAREKFLEALSRVYPLAAREPRIEFEDPQKDIARALGVDEASVSRAINPPRGRAPSDAVYERLTKRAEDLAELVETRAELARLREETSSLPPPRGRALVLGAALALGIAVGTAGMWLFSRNEPRLGPDAPSSMVALEADAERIRSMRRAVFELWSRLNQEEISVAALSFNSEVRAGRIDVVNVDNVGVLATNIEVILSRNRDLLWAVDLPTEPGVDLRHAVTSSVDNRIDESVRVMVPLILDGRVSAPQLHDLIVQTVSRAQMRNMQNIDAYVDSVSRQHAASLE